MEEHYERESRETVCRFLSKSDEITQKHKHSNNYHKLSEFKMAFKLNFYSLTSTVHVFQVDASDMLYLNLVWWKSIDLIYFPSLSTAKQKVEAICRSCCDHSRFLIIDWLLFANGDRQFCVNYCPLLNIYTSQWNWNINLTYSVTIILYSCHLWIT